MSSPFPASASFPNESLDCRRARGALLEKEEALRASIEEVASLRRALPPGGEVLRLLSSEANTYHTDDLGEGSDGGQWPMANVFTRRDGTVRHFWASEMLFSEPMAEGQNQRHVDLLWPLWNVLDATPEGRGTDWFPSLDAERA